MKTTHFFTKTLMILFIFLLLPCVVGVSPLYAEEEPWRFNVNVYGWLPEAPADIIINDEEVAHLPESFDTIIDGLQMAAMFELQAHKGPFGVFASSMYFDGEGDKHFTGLLDEKRKVTVSERLWLISYGASYDIGPFNLGENSGAPTVILQPYVGGLYFYDDLEMNVEPGALDLGLDYKTTIKFNTPIIGANTLWDITKNWTLRVGGNYGGWDVDHVKETYEFLGAAGYRFTMWDVNSKVFAGYRYVHINLKKNDIQIKVDVKGPLFGIGWEF